MPPGGIEARVKQMTTLSRFTHNLFTADEMGELIEDAAAELNGASYDSNEASGNRCTSICFQLWSR